MVKRVWGVRGGEGGWEMGIWSPGEPKFCRPSRFVQSFADRADFFRKNASTEPILYKFQPIEPKKLENAFAEP